MRRAGIETRWLHFSGEGVLTLLERGKTWLPEWRDHSSAGFNGLPGFPVDQFWLKPVSGLKGSSRPTYRYQGKRVNMLGNGHQGTKSGRFCN